ncbi:hypothetical protein NPIL_292451 [Nephila pilipes]|uniref:Uncharacterized protein n=1 Tax=Nephila pilipes TaxID=299642 RepID=A0A8X6KEF2_NEPPI|nr:hypothetical protein NPIL_292451 [Nephila pilipes]
MCILIALTPLPCRRLIKNSEAKSIPPLRNVVLKGTLWPINHSPRKFRVKSGTDDTASHFSAIGSFCSCDPILLFYRRIDTCPLLRANTFDDKM